jgi:hypothetical protein
MRVLTNCYVGTTFYSLRQYSEEVKRSFVFQSRKGKSKLNVLLDWRSNFD